MWVNQRGLPDRPALIRAGHRVENPVLTPRSPSYVRAVGSPSVKPAGLRRPSRSKDAAPAPVDPPAPSDGYRGCDARMHEEEARCGRGPWTERNGTERTMDGPTVFVGIDVAKGWLDVAERPSGRVWRVAND